MKMRNSEKKNGENGKKKSGKHDNIVYIISKPLLLHQKFQEQHQHFLLS